VPALYYRKCPLVRKTTENTGFSFLSCYCSATFVPISPAACHKCHKCRHINFPVVLVLFNKEIQSIMSYFDATIYCAGDHRAAEKQQKQAAQNDQQEAPATSVDSQTTVGTPSTEFVTPYPHPEACHAMV
jgi:nuclear transcription factor Y alpha